MLFSLRRVSLRKAQRHISLSFFSFLCSLNNLIASLVMNFLPFLALLALSCSLFTFSPNDSLTEWPTERVMGERDWSNLLLFREWFPLHFDSSSTAAASHSVSNQNLRLHLQCRLKHRLTALVLFLLGLNFGMLHQFAGADKIIKVIAAFVWPFGVLLIPHSKGAVSRKSR